MVFIHTVFLFRIQVAETIEINAHLMSITCVDKDIKEPNNVLRYKLNPLDDFSKDKFTLTNNILTVSMELFSLKVRSLPKIENAIL